MNNAKDGRQLDKVLARVSADARQALGDNLVSLLLYGSQARGDATPGSDVNVLFVVRDGSAAGLEPLQKQVPVWLKLGVAAPVVFEQDQLGRSLDTFAFEFLEMAAAHRVLAGEDPFAEFTPDWEAVRRELEEEAREKAILLQRRWMASGGKDTLMREIIVDTVPGFLSVLRGTLHMQAKSMVPVSTQAIFGGAVHFAGFDPHVWKRLWETAEGLHLESTSQLTQLMKDYLEQARGLVRHIDGLLN